LTSVRDLEWKARRHSPNLGKQSTNTIILNAGDDLEHDTEAAKDQSEEGRDELAEIDEGKDAVGSGKDHVNRSTDESLGIIDSTIEDDFHLIYNGRDFLDGAVDGRKTL